jgi:hypothetical protein
MARLSALLPAAAAAVFLIACANVAAFLLSRGSARSQETAVRVALGASRHQLGRQLLADSFALSLIGAAGGILLAVWTSQIIPALFFEEDAEHLVFAPNVTGIVLASAACAVITVGCGLLPLFEIRADKPALVLRRGGGVPSPAMRRVRSGLVMAQMACCCLLVISTGLLLEGFRSALRTSTANRLGRPILATLRARLGFNRPDLGLQYFHDAERAALELPGVSETAWTGTLPGSRSTWQSIRIELPGLPVRNAVMDVVALTPRTQALIDTTPRAGRLFGGADTPQSCRVAVVNEEAASDLFHGDAVGRSIEDLAGQRVEIVGVVAVRKAKKASAPTRPTIYFYAQQTGLPDDQSRLPDDHAGLPNDQTGRPDDHAERATFRVPVYTRPEPKGVVDASVVSQSYFAALGVTPVAGQVFRDEPEPGTCRVAVVNQEAAELYFAGHAIGGAVIDGSGNRTTIIGVVHSPPLSAAQRSVEPAIYFPMTQDFLPRMTLILGAIHPDAAMLGALQRKLDTVGGGAGPAVVTTLETQLSRTALAAERIATQLVGVSAATALTLGVLGIYGALAEFARHRRREIALRMALGAQRWRVMLQVVREGVRLAAIGAVAGGAASLPVMRWLGRITPETAAPSLWIWLAAPLALMLAVTIASVLPVGRALAVDPLTVLRND